MLQTPPLILLSTARYPLSETAGERHHLGKTAPTISCRSLFRRVLAMLCCMASTLSAETFENFTYTDNGTSITITGYPTAATGAVIIPATILEKPVTSIGSYAFSHCAALTSVTIPDSVTSIGFNAFFSCAALTSITIPLGVTSIEQSTFYACYALTSITIPDSVTSIGRSAFQSCTALTSLTIPGSVTSIGLSAFQSCTALTSLTIPTSITSIGQYAFSTCISLTSITIPPGVASIEEGTFSNCTSLMSVTIPASVTSIGVSAFFFCTALNNIAIPANVTTIGNTAFLYCSDLTSVTIPTGVTSIGMTVFGFCTSLTSATIPEGVTSIGHSMFQNCTSLTSITIPASVTSIGNVAFYACNSLTDFNVDVLNSNYSSLNGALFNKNQTELVQYPGGKTGSAVIPTSVTKIGSGAFAFCRSLTSVTIPSGVTSITTNAFSNCKELTDITVDKYNANYASLDGMLFNRNLTTLIQCPGGKAGAIMIPASVTSIISNAFSNCIKLTSFTVNNLSTKYSSMDGVPVRQNPGHAHPMSRRQSRELYDPFQRYQHRKQCVLGLHLPNERNDTGGCNKHRQQCIF